MNSIIDSVTASRRLKIFTAYYAMIYVIVNLLLNLLSTGVPFFGSGVGKILFKLISLIIQAPFMFGLVRGIITKDYSVAKGLGAFGDTKNYLSYSAYIAISLAYDLIGMAIESMGNKSGTVLMVGTILYVTHSILRFFVNLFLVKMYFDSIDSGSLTLGNTIKGCGKLLAKRPMKFLGAELFMLVVGLAVTVISSMIAGLLPQHWAVSIILTCINSVQYGFIIFSWPVYYLYYRASFDE